jgi:hypothetical protein
MPVWFGKRSKKRRIEQTAPTERNAMSNTSTAKQHQHTDPQDRRWGAIGIAAVAAAKSVKPHQSKPSRRDATLTKLIDSASE